MKMRKTPKSKKAKVQQYKNATKTSKPNSVQMQECEKQFPNNATTIKIYKKVSDGNIIKT